MEQNGKLDKLELLEQTEYFGYVRVIARSYHFIEHFFTIPSHKQGGVVRKMWTCYRPFIRLANDE